MEFLLRKGAATQAEISRGTGLSPATIARHKQRLIDLGLIKRVPRGLEAIPRGEDHLDRVARTCWTDGASDRQRALYGWDSQDERASQWPSTSGRCSLPGPPRRVTGSGVIQQVRYWVSPASLMGPPERQCDGTTTPEFGVGVVMMTAG